MSALELLLLSSPPNVVATLPDLAAIARSVGGPGVDVTAIASPIQDPHFVDPKPSYVVKLRDADVLLVNGLQLEIGWAPPLLAGARNPKVHAGAPGHVDCSRGVPVIEVPIGEVTRAQGDVHPLGNPHYLLDPLNGIIVAHTVAEALGRADPENANAYAAREKAFSRALLERLYGASLVAEIGEGKLVRLARSGELYPFLEENRLSDRLGGWARDMRPLRGKKIVFFHKSFSYFADRFGITVADHVEQKAGIQPGPGHLASLIERMRKEQITVLGTHAFYDGKVARLVAEKAGAELVVLPLASDGEEGDYFDLFDAIVERFVRAAGA
jgi:ABC-type Zn uptake system ZnuABC Zn-binding protein ZnuA